MKRIIGLGIILIGFLAVGLIAGPQVVLKVKVQTANIHSEPEMSSGVIAQVKIGTMYESSNKVGDFYEISITDKDGRTTYGFIHASVVEVLITKEEKVTEEEEEAKESEPKPEVKPQRVEPAYAGFKRKGLGLYVGGSSTSDYGSGLAFGANFYFGITKKIGIEVGLLRFQATTKDNDDIEKISKGKLAVIPMQISLMARFPVGAKIVPYVTGGAGYYLNKFTLDRNLVKTWSDLGLDLNETIDHAVGYHIGAGLDYFFNPRIAIAANVKYCRFTAKGSWTLTDTGTDIVASGKLSNLKLGAIILGIGMKYAF